MACLVIGNRETGFWGNWKGLQASCWSEETVVRFKCQSFAWVLKENTNE